MKVQFDTAEYVRSHCREPRGRGGWAFKADGDMEFTFTPSMTYAEAKRWIKNHRPNVSVWTVGP